jgi:lipoprotein signal peptidase
MNMMNTRYQRGFINPEMSIVLVIVLIVTAVAAPFVLRLRDSHPTIALVLTVLGGGALAITALLATVESIQLQGRKVGITMPIVIVIGIALIAVIHHHRKKAENNPVEHTAEPAPGAAPVDAHR